MKKFRYTIIILLLGIIFYLLNAISPIFFRNSYGAGRKAKDFRVTGHRGAAGLAPENTIESIQKALMLKADRIEIDVQQTKDNQIVVIHDYTVDRTTNGKGAIKDLTLAEIKSFNIKGEGLQITGLKIPTLDEVLDAMNNSAVLLIEIKKEKDLYPGIEQRVVDIINRHNAREICIVHSFNDDVLIKIHAVDSLIILHKLFIAKLPLLNIIFDGKFRCRKLKDYNFISDFSINYPFVTKSVIDKIHAMNKKVNVWTVDDTAKMKKLIDLGVDGIITNYPDRLIKLKQKL